MGKHRYFELDEFLRSDTAKRKGIDNTPTFEVVDHLDELVEKILDPLRSAYGKPITISSGYRCPALNRAVGGSSTSVHMLGYAADMTVGDSFEDFCDFAQEWLKKQLARFDQLITESNSRTGDKWLHIGLYNNAGQQRGQIKIITV